MTLVAVVLVALAGTSAGQTRARAPQGSTEVVIDRAYARFFAPETGGFRKPQFVGERNLAFQARLMAIADMGTLDAKVLDRHVRAALDVHVAEVLLSNLPLEKQPELGELVAVQTAMRTEFIRRAGGEESLAKIAAHEGLTKDEVEDLIGRQLRAAYYIDHAVAPILRPTEDRLREVFRTSAHPYRGAKYDDVRTALLQWYLVERLRVAEVSFYQSARGRVELTILPP